MQRKFRLTRSDDISRARRSGKSHAGPLVILITQANDSSNLRVSIIAGRTVGNAVRRNRAKRLLREAMRPLVPHLPTGWDLLLIARPDLCNATLDQTRAALATLLRRAGLTAVHES